MKSLRRLVERQMNAWIHTVNRSDIVNDCLLVPVPSSHRFVVCPYLAAVALAAFRINRGDLVEYFLL